MTAKTTNTLLPDYAIAQINSLGGPPLPLRQSGPALKVILENRDAANTRISGWRAALSLMTYY